MNRWQWGILSGTALGVSVWVNGFGTLVAALAAAIFGLLGGWIMGAKVIP